VIHTSIQKSTFTTHNTHKKHFTFISVFLYLLLFSFLTACGGGSNTPSTLDTNEEVKLTIVLGSSITLDASENSDLSSDTATYQWEIVGVPEGSTLIELNDSSSMTTTFAPDLKGEYKLSLIISDGNSVSSPILFSINVEDDFTNITVPQANAGEDRSALIGSEVALNGSGIFIDNIEYQWTLDSVPSGSSITTSDLSDTAISNPTFIPDVPGDYIFTLVIKSGELSSRASKIKITIVTENTAPIANAGPDQLINTLSLVTLDGSASFDAESVSLTYSWSMTPPNGSNAVLDMTSPEHPSFTPDLNGEYIILLSVFDGKDNSEVVDSVTITVNTPNAAPVADAGSDEPVDTLSLVTLDGSASSDAEGGSLTYNWSMTKPSGSSAVLDITTPEHPSFTADIDGSYEISLSVFDGENNSTVDTVIITATTNLAPIAKAGSDKSVDTLSLVTLDGSASSDANGDSLIFTWNMTKPSGSTAVLDITTPEHPSFTPDIEGEYEISLSVSDGKVDSTLVDIVVITATTNLAPIANAGSDQSVDTLSLVTLDGSASSDSNGDALIFTWNMTKPNGSNAVLNTSIPENPSFTPDIDGDYEISLSVSDGKVDSTLTDIVVINATTNIAPIANAGSDQSVNTLSLVTLDGSTSSDENGDSLIYSWSMTPPINSNAVLNNVTLKKPTFTPDIDGEYQISLTVFDDIDDSALSDTVSITITASTPDLPPVANAGPNQFIAVNDPVTLDGSRSYDPEDKEITYSWEIIESPADSSASLTSSTTAVTMFTPNAIGVYIVSLEVNDGANSSQINTIISASEPGEGSIIEPKILSYSAPSAFPYAGNMQMVSSYYQVDGLDSEIFYHIYLTELDNNVDLIVYGDSSFTNIICESRNSLKRHENCIGKTLETSNSLFIEVNGDLAADNAQFMLNINPAINEGTASNPVAITLDTPYLGTTSSNTENSDISYYQVTGIKSSKDYVVSLKDKTNSLRLWVGNSSIAPRCRSALGIELDKNNLCNIKGNSTGSFYIRVYHDVGASFGGKSFELFVTEGQAVKSEGNDSSPILLTYGGALLQHDGKVDTNTSHYQLSGLNSGADYDLWFSTNSDDAYLEVQNNNGVTISGNNFPKRFSFKASSPTVKLKVLGDESKIGATFTLSVRENNVQPEPEGIITDPVVLPYVTDSFFHLGSVDTSNSYYKITNLPTDRNLIVSITELTDDADMSIYSDHEYSDLICTSSLFDINPESCTHFPSNSDLYIKVNGSKTWKGTTFNLTIAPPLFESEGSADDPVNLDSAIVMDTGQQGRVDLGLSYYRLDNLTANTDYEIRLDQPSGDVDLYVYASDFSAANPTCKSEEWEDLYEENCVATTSDTFLLIKVSGGWSGIGASFTIKAIER